MGDFLELGLELGDKLIDKGFDKLPDRITSPLGAEIPKPNFHYHRRKGSKDSHPKRSATMPVEPERRRGKDWNGYESDTESSPRRGERRNELVRRDDRGGVDMYAPNPAYDGRRPRMVTRRSQSYAPPRRRLSPSYESGSRTPSPGGKKQNVLTNPLATGTLGALVGGVLANQAGKATGYDYRRENLTPATKSKRSRSSRRPGEGDEALLTLAGALIGGIGGALAGDKWKQRKKIREIEGKEWEAQVAREDWEREGHEAEAWAQNSSRDYDRQVREARRWQAQVEAGERERERLGRDDVVVYEETVRRRPDGREEVVRILPVYEDKWYGDDTDRERRIDAGPKYERRERRRSVGDDLRDPRRGWNMDYNANYGYDDRGRDPEREKYRMAGR